MSSEEANKPLHLPEIHTERIAHAQNIIDQHNRDAASWTHRIAMNLMPTWFKAFSTSARDYLALTLYLAKCLLKIVALDYCLLVFAHVFLLPGAEPGVVQLSAKDIVPTITQLDKLYVEGSLMILPFQLELVADNLTRHETYIINSDLPQRICLSNQVRIIKDNTRDAADTVDDWVSGVLVKFDLQELASWKVGFFELFNSQATTSQVHKENAKIWIGFFERLDNKAQELQILSHIAHAQLRTLQECLHKMRRAIANELQQTGRLKGHAMSGENSFESAKAIERITKLHEQDRVLRFLSTIQVDAEIVFSAAEKPLKQVRTGISSFKALFEEPASHLLRRIGASMHPLNKKLNSQISAILEQNRALIKMQAKQEKIFEDHIRIMNIEGEKYAHASNANFPRSKAFDYSSHHANSDSSGEGLSDSAGKEEPPTSDSGFDFEEASKWVGFGTQCLTGIGALASLIGFRRLYGVWDVYHRF
ncbi:uncharacterized protein LY89DRAFT_737229 [Mollisia scopiformis]|uniref:Uncharacterized protein n=1 Tax=Mollisia scopiformis TaxID=149040 RepID=A0A194WZ73_MOLSC|nr:uncharacterized protein LY89DRAFT_737229 [Mollisia scopiformis]KUJ13250.1 hypothetical protein LY89DRAFT_737229 [Mollisia scopiformis]